MKGNRISLRNLVEQELGIAIQTGEHSSVRLDDLIVVFISKSALRLLTRELRWRCTDCIERNGRVDLCHVTPRQRRSGKEQATAVVVNEK